MWKTIKQSQQQFIPEQTSENPSCDHEKIECILTAQGIERYLCVLLMCFAGLLARYPRFNTQKGAIFTIY